MRCLPWLVFSLTLLTGCPWISQTSHDERTANLLDDTGGDVTDADGDGYSSAVDCDDNSAAVYPGADETCNGIDDDCDEQIDEDDAVDAPAWYADSDGDDWGVDTDVLVQCEQPSGYVADDGDCDESDSAVNPGADELCDEIDNDCDDEVDEDDAVDALLWYADGDYDLYGDPDDSTTACEQPSGYVSDATDCDDSDSAVNPSATEICDEFDNDCDGLTDDEDDPVSETTLWWSDSDGDGYGDSSIATEACLQPTGMVDSAIQEDCDDSNAKVNPSSTEVCDEVDNDCDGTTDGASAVDATDWYTDADGDGYGDPATLERSCDAGSGHVTDHNDCDDTDAAIYPGADEHCDGVDEDCDGTVDEDDALDVLTWYADTDSDGYGDAASTDIDCSQPTGFVADSTDCDDGDAAAFPGADEYCDSVDNDCDGTTDEDDALDALTWFADKDGDGYGADSPTQLACTQPSTYAAASGDCDDLDASINPGASEICDGADNDCDGDTDEDDAVDASTWYLDADGDDYGLASDSTTSCGEPDGYTSNSADCEDNDATINPAADEYCDGADNDCDGTTDEGDAVDAATWYIDGDGDGYGVSTTTSVACTAPSGYAATDDDCDDTDATVSPGATEIWYDGFDQDCDGASDYDADADGYDSDAYSGTDCDDTDSDVNPGASEIGLNGVDEDCDGNDGDDMSLGDAHLVVAGDTLGDRLGWSVSSAGDINGDSYDDIMIGAPNYDSGAGQVLVFLGPTDEGDFAMDEADFVISGDSGSALGSAIASVGDIDSDGYGDIILGASGQSSGAGMAYLIHGPITSDRAGNLKSMSIGGGTGHALGDFVGGGPDVDGDGYGDLFVGAPMQDYGYTEGGRFYVVPSTFSTAVTASSVADITARGRNTEAHIGISACAGDYDGDGVVDMVVAGDKANVGGNYRGAAYLVIGPVDHAEYDFNNSDDYDGRIYGYSSATYFGHSMADVGDVDGDGYTDLLVGAPKHDNGSSDTGAAFLFLGSWSDGVATTTSAAQFYGSTGEEAGRSVTGMGDLDGDGRDDWSVGVIFDNPIGVDCGAAYIMIDRYSGSYSASSADGALEGEAYLDLAGKSLANAGDTDGDAVNDLLVGAPQYDDDAGTSTGAGAAYLITGLTF